MRYASSMSRDIAWHATDDLYIVYHRPSGDTHLLAPDLFAILGAIDGRPLDAPGVLARLAADHDIETEGDAALAVIDARLAELTALGLADAA